MGSRFSGLGHALYDSKRRQFLGRDGAGWGKRCSNAEDLEKHIRNYF